MKLVALAFTLFLTGCGCTSHCIMGFGPGNPVFNAMADMYDSNDPCQSQNWPENGGKMNMSGYQRGPSGYPTFCGASKPAVYVQSRVNSNGVYVRSHMRSSPDNTTTNNYYSKR